MANKSKPTKKNIRQGQTVYMVCMYGKGVRKMAVISDYSWLCRIKFWPTWCVRKQILIKIIEEFGNREFFFSRGKAEKRARSLRRQYKNGE